MRFWIGCLVVLCAVTVAPAQAQLVGTAFTYQGRLEVSNAPANGSYDLRFDVYDTAGGPTPIAGSTPLLIDNLSVTDGVFTVPLDFGNAVFLGGPVFLEIGVRAGSAGGPGDFTGFTALTPRQPVTPAPYALHAEKVAMNSVGADEIADDSIGSGDVDASQIQLRSGTMDTTCGAAGLAIKTIASNGTVTCDSGPTVSSPLVKSGNDIALPEATNYARKDSAAGNQSFDLQDAGSATLHLDYSNDRVGILDTTPERALDVVGTVRADAFELRNGGVARVNLTGAAFVPASSNVVTYIQAVDGQGYIGGSAGGTVVLTAPVSLPEGAVPILLSCYWYDNDSDSDFSTIDISLRKRAPQDFVSTIVASISDATIGASTIMNGSSALFTGAAVAANEFHYLRAALTVSTGNSSLLRFYGCSVSYSYAQLAN